jgi:hypothetical protein
MVVVHYGGNLDEFSVSSLYSMYRTFCYLYWFLLTNGPGTSLYVHSIAFEQKYYDHHAA